MRVRVSSVESETGVLRWGYSVLETRTLVMHRKGLSKVWLFPERKSAQHSRTLHSSVIAGRKISASTSRVYI